MQSNNERVASAIQVKDFRCFSDLTVTFEKPISVIIGQNGTGKTSLFEALYFSCYLRSFRAMHTRELIKMGSDSFFTRLQLLGNNSAIENNLQVGFANKKRIVRIDSRSVASHKELLDHYRVISICEDDLELVKEGPQQRRSFFDQLLMVEDPETVFLFREFRAAVDHKNALLQQQYIDQEMYDLWTHQVIDKSNRIRILRIEALKQCENRINTILTTHQKDDFQIAFHYKKKDGFELQKSEELRLKRTIHGAHLDDIGISLRGKSSRLYASRGQQKLIVLLMKVVQMERLFEKRGNGILLLDDFVTDFDDQALSDVFFILSQLKAQLIFSTPNKSGPLISLLKKVDAQIITL